MNHHKKKIVKNLTKKWQTGKQSPYTIHSLSEFLMDSKRLMKKIPLTFCRKKAQLQFVMKRDMWKTVIQTRSKAPSHLRFGTRFDDEPASVVAGMFTLQGGRGGSTVVRVFFCFYLHYPKILRAQPKMFKDCQSRLGLFVWSKNPLSATEHAQRLSKQMQFAKNFKCGSNSESQSNRETMT